MVDCGGIGLKQLAHLLEKPGRLADVPASEISREDQVIAALLKRSLCDVHETDLVGSADLLETFSDVGGH